MTRYDAEKILPLDLVRQHTRTDDVMTVSDELLMLYRDSALQAAQEYTGIPIRERQTVTEPVSIPRRRHHAFYDNRANYFTHKIGGIFAMPQVYFYGGRSVGVQTIMVAVNTREIRLPVPVDFGIGCCNPCADADTPRIQYVSGYSCEADIPAAIAHGALKYIAHSIANAGDTVEKLGGFLTGREVSPALASGAIEIWRSAMPEAV